MRRGIGLMSVVDVEGADDAVLDEAGEVMRAGVVPAELLAATVALTDRPGVPGEPGVLQSGWAHLPASARAGEGDDGKADALGVGKGEFVLAVVREPVLFVGDAVVAPGAEPVSCGVAKAVVVRSKAEGSVRSKAESCSGPIVSWRLSSNLNLLQRRIGLCGDAT